MATGTYRLTTDRDRYSVPIVMKSDPAALREIRERNGHTGRSLAEKSGVSQQRISDLEKDAVRVFPTTMRRLADALGVEIEEIATVCADEEQVAS